MVAFTAAAASFQVESPDGRNAIRLDATASLAVEVLRRPAPGSDWLPLTEPSPVALSVEGRVPLGGNGNCSPAGAPHASVDAFGGRRLEVDFAGGWRVELAARNDGVAYRFATAWPGRVRVLDETASLVFASAKQRAFAAHAHGDWHGDPFQNSWERDYRPFTVGELESGTNHLYCAPTVFLYPQAAMAVTESDLLDYPGWNLVRNAAASNRLDAVFARHPLAVTNETPECGVTAHRTRYLRVTRRADWLVETDGTRTYPWRTFMLADSPARLPEAKIVDELATPSRIGDAAWVKPGLALWDWWCARNLAGVDFRTGSNTETYLAFIDFAGANAIPYVVIDAGWSVRTNVFAVSGCVDLPRVLARAAKRRVGLILWAAWAQLEGREREVLAHYAAKGVKGFKVDFIDRDDDEAVRFVERLAAAAAECRLVLDLHGIYKPTGLSTTYPNVLNYEGVAGLEQMKWERPYEAPVNDCALVFTRMLAGPMDYTPGAMRNHARGTYAADLMRPGSEGTRAHQMALFVLYRAPLQMLCDSPTQYARNRECFDFMRATPTVWDETRGLFGEIGVNAGLARRRGGEWWVGAIGDWRRQEVEIDTRFLGSGKWEMEVFRDGVNADRDAEDYAHERRRIAAGERIRFALMPGGGLVARFRRR